MTFLEPSWAGANATVAVVFRGGNSARLGRDKALVELGGETLLERTKTRLAPQCRRVMLSVQRGETQPSDDEIVDLDGSGKGGTLLGLVAALRWASQQEGARYLLTSPVDTPFLPKNLAQGLATAMVREGSRSAVAVSGERMHGLSALFDVSMLPDVERLVLQDGERMVQALHKVLRSATVVFDHDPVDPFLNINTDEDLERAKAMLHQR